MCLTGEQTDLISRNYALIRQHERSYSSLFYHRLLHRYPFTRTLFPDDMGHQADVFRETLDALIESVGDMDRQLPRLTELARRHVGYGVEARQYPAVGEVLIDSFGEMLGDRFTPAMRQAWGALYDLVASAMIRSAYPERSLADQR